MLSGTRCCGRWLTSPVGMLCVTRSGWCGPRMTGAAVSPGSQLLERARQRILDCNDGKPPKLLDPFAGGGSIPLEALRLGCEVEASDLNPVAVLILKGTVEYPQKYGQPNSRPVPDYILRGGTPAGPKPLHR